MQLHPTSVSLIRYALQLFILKGNSKELAAPSCAPHCGVPPRAAPWMPPVPPGTTVYFLLASPGQPDQGQAVEGLLIEDGDDKLIVGVPVETPLSQAAERHRLADGVSVSFISVQSGFATTARPEGWKAKFAFARGGAPRLKELLKVYYRSDVEISEAETAKSHASTSFQQIASLQQRIQELEQAPASSASIPASRPRPADFVAAAASSSAAAAPGSPYADLLSIWNVNAPSSTPAPTGFDWNGDMEEDDDEDGEMDYAAPGGATVPVGQSGSPARNTRPPAATAASNMGAAASPQEFLLMTMANTLLQQNIGKKKYDDGDSDDEKNPGLKAFDRIQRITDRTMKGDRRLMMDFEKDMRRELGVVPGQPWTLHDDWRMTRWGKLRGLSRAYLMDIAVYEHLRAGRVQQAINQLIQNMKAKKQTALDGGSWDVSWHLTGLPDRTERAPFAGSHTEMSAIAAYRKAMKDLAMGKPMIGPKLSDGEDNDDPVNAIEKKKKADAKRKAAAEAAAARKTAEESKKPPGQQTAGK